jgi:hypothetical protein
LRTVLVGQTIVFCRLSFPETDLEK